MTQTNSTSAFSLTIKGILVALVGLYLKSADTPLVEGELETLIDSVVQLVGILIAAYGRIRQGDISWFGMRK